MRPIFFVPWWWYLWSRGPRFSLRRLLGRALLGAILGAILGGAAVWAFRGRNGAPWMAALACAEGGAVLATIWSLVEPLWIALSASLFERRIATTALRGVSFGLMFAYAALAGYAIFANAGHVSDLERWLVSLDRSDGVLGGSLRFVTGATLVCYPIVIALRQLLIASDGLRLVPERRPEPRPGPAPHAFRPNEPRTFIPPPPPGPVPTAYEVPKPPPARVIRTESGPLRPLDDEP